MIRKSGILKVMLTIASIFWASLAISNVMLHVEDAWTPTVPPTMISHAGYLKLVNHGHQPLVLIAASSPNYERIEFHTSEMKDNMVSMKMIDQVTIGSHQSVHFKPGSLHLMMHKPVDVPPEGGFVKLSLVFESGYTQDVELKVMKRQSQMNMQSHSHHH